MSHEDGSGKPNLTAGRTDGWPQVSKMTTISPNWQKTNGRAIIPAVTIKGKAPMSDPDLTFLGERIARIQAELRDLRGLRTDVAHLRTDLTHLRAEVAERFGALSERIDAQNERIDNLERATSERFENLDRALDARFDQVHQTMATNLAIVLQAIKGQSPPA